MRLPTLAAVFALLSAAYQFSGPLPPLPTGPFFPKGRTLILTAHPDDEAMFFGPAVLALTAEKGRDVWALCMSTGDADGQGKERRVELLNAYTVLGLKPKRLDVLDHPQLRDGMDTVWDPKVVARLVQEIIDAYDISVVITFDSQGVSSHPNHAALAPASLLLRPSPSSRSRSKSASSLKVYHLVTHSTFPSKYFSFLPSLLSRYAPPVPASVQRERAERAAARGGGAPAEVVVRHGLRGWERLVEGMRSHVSQMVWFRWGWIAASRYMFEGTFRLVSPPESASAQ